MVSGLIIDAFGELRDQQEQVKEDMEVREDSILPTYGLPRNITQLDDFIYCNMEEALHIVSSLHHCKRLHSIYYHIQCCIVLNKTRFIIRLRILMTIILSRGSLKG